MSIKKQSIVFTNFWNAEKILTSKSLIVDQVDIFSDPCQFSSIALGTPKNLTCLSLMNKLPFLAPSWDILKEEKKSPDWTKYTKEYKKILVANKKDVVQYLEGLDAGSLHLLCCWENTCSGANCHRRILYDALKKSKRTCNLANYYYRHGNE